jgi:hypothetical protein
MSRHIREEKRDNGELSCGACIAGHTGGQMAPIPPPPMTRACAHVPSPTPHPHPYNGQAGHPFPRTGLPGPACGIPPP